MYPAVLNGALGVVPLSGLLSPLGSETESMSGPWPFPSTSSTSGLVRVPEPTKLPSSRWHASGVLARLPFTYNRLRTKWDRLACLPLFRDRKADGVPFVSGGESAIPTLWRKLRSARVSFTRLAAVRDNDAELPRFASKVLNSLFPGKVASCKESVPRNQGVLKIETGGGIRTR